MQRSAEQLADVEGIRRNALWEAAFLFHKCSHSNLASQRLGEQGMHSWCMFNAYHSAYLGAKGIMALLGVALPSLGGKQVAIDPFPEPKKPIKKSASNPTLPQFQDFLLIRLPMLDQRFVWEGFQRLLRVSKVGCWDMRLRQELLTISCDKITPPRNHFLYQAQFWPLNDLMSDATVEEMDHLIGNELDTDQQGFLLRLSFCIYRLFEQLMSDLGEQSAIIKAQLNGSRSYVDSAQPEFGRYRSFLSQIASEAGGPQ